MRSQRRFGYYTDCHCFVEEIKGHVELMSQVLVANQTPF